MTTNGTTHIELSNGDKIPALGFGTWQIEGDACREAVGDALEIGYRHIDTAQMYGNEREVGQAIRDSGVPRDEIFLTTKVWWESSSREAAARSIDESLERLGLEQVDLLLMHWPPPSGIEPMLDAMNEALTQGKTRLLGVSNCPPKLAERARELAPIVCNQVEYHPFLDQSAVLEHARSNGMWVTAYCPLAQGKVVRHPTIGQIALLHGRTPAQATLRWLLGQDRVAVIPRASDPEHRRENFAALDFDLTPAQHETIGVLARGERLIDPEWAPDWGVEEPEKATSDGG